MGWFDMTIECGLTNLASCIPEKMYDFIINVVNAPIQPLLNLTKSLLTEPVSVSLFSPLWAIMIYVISIFYGLLILYSGFNFMLAGYDSAKRANAKEWFQNVLIMIVLVQASFFIYSAVIDIGSGLTAGVINMIDEHFFMITADNIVNIGLQFCFGIFYLIALLGSVIILTLRYIIVSSGIVLIPIAIFLYFIPPLQECGKLIKNFLGIAIFITFLDAIILLVCSMIVAIPLFENFKILIMICAVYGINLMMIYLMFFSIIKSATKTGWSVAKVAMKIKMWVG